MENGARAGWNEEEGGDEDGAGSGDGARTETRTRGGAGEGAGGGTGERWVGWGKRETERDGREEGLGILIWLEKVILPALLFI